MVRDRASEREVQLVTQILELVKPLAQEEARPPLHGQHLQLTKVVEATKVWHRLQIQKVIDEVLLCLEKWVLSSSCSLRT